MYYYIEIGQYPNISVNSDIVVDSSPKPKVVFEEVKKITEMLRTRNREVHVFNLSDIRRSNGFLHFVSQYLMEVKVSEERAFRDWRKYSKDLLEKMWTFDKKMIDAMGLDSKVRLVSLNRKKRNNGFPICRI